MPELRDPIITRLSVAGPISKLVTACEGNPAPLSVYGEFFSSYPVINLLYVANNAFLSTIVFSFLPYLSFGHHCEVRNAKKIDSIFHKQAAVCTEFSAVPAFTVMAGSVMTATRLPQYMKFLSASNENI